LVTYLERTGTPPVVSCTNAALQLPLTSDPGTRFQYGISTDWVGKAVEAISDWMPTFTTTSSRRRR
jgi:hypothetical protein